MKLYENANLVISPNRDLFHDLHVIKATEEQIYKIFHIYGIISVSCFYLDPLKQPNGDICDLGAAMLHKMGHSALSTDNMNILYT